MVLSPLRRLVAEQHPAPRGHDRDGGECVAAQAGQQLGAVPVAVPERDVYCSNDRFLGIYKVDVNFSRCKWLDFVILTDVDMGRAMAFF